MIISKHYNYSLKTEVHDRSMVSNVRYYVVLICTLMLSSLVQSQQISVFVHPSKDSVLIGDKIDLTIQIKYPKDLKIDGLDFSNYDKIENQLYTIDTVHQGKYADLSILDVGNWKALSSEKIVNGSRLNPVLSGDYNVIENKVVIAIYNDGVYKIPTPELLGIDSKEEVISSAGQVVKVYLPAKMQADSIALNPIKDIMVEKANWSDYLWILYLICGFVVLAILIIYLKRRKTVPKVEAPITERVIPAHEKALTSLKALAAAQLWQHGQIKEYQSRLTDIIRIYLEDRYHVKAMEMTTDEISTVMERSGFDQKNIAGLREILEVADLVKFAKAIPAEEIHEVFMKKAVDFVENTKEAASLSNDLNASTHA